MASLYIVKKLQALLGSADLVEMYLRKYGELLNETYVEQIKNNAEASRKAATGAPVAKPEGDDPVFEMLYQCPACYKENVVIYQLRSKSQAIKETLFLVPQYSGIAKYFAVDFNLLQTGVCPDCLFASPDPRDWASQSKFTGKSTPSQLNEHTRLLADIRNEELKRKSAFPGTRTDIDYFIRPRNYEKAIEAIKLSIMRAELEAKYNLPAVSFKLASYNLKIADIEKKMGKADYIETLKKAEQYFSTAALKSECPTIALEMMCIYQVVALNMFLKNKEKAAEYFKITKNALRAREKEAKFEPSPEARVALSEVSRWDKRISLLWEYRDDPEFWKNV